MDATSGAPGGRPLHWLPCGLTALLLSLERTDSLAVQLKAFNVTQAVKSLLSLNKNPQTELWGVPSGSRSGSLDALRDLAKPFYGLHLSGSALASHLCQCEDDCECCACGEPDCALCESCVSEEDFEYEDHPHYHHHHGVPELQPYLWGFPLAGSLPYAPKGASEAFLRRESEPQRFASKKLGWVRPLERRAEVVQSGSIGNFVEENVVAEDDAQEFKGAALKSRSMWTVKFASRRRDDAEDVQGSPNSNPKEKLEDSLPRINDVAEADSETQNSHATRELIQDSEAVPTKSRSVNFDSRRKSDAQVVQVSPNSSPKEKLEDTAQSISTDNLAESRARHEPIEDTVASSSSACAPLARLSSNWGPVGIQAAAAAAAVAVDPEAAKWNFRMGQNAGAGALAGGVVSLCLHPVDTVKTIVQSQTGGSRNLLPILSSVLSERGLKGLYRGLGSNLASSAPTSAIYTLTYEAVKAGLLRHIPEGMSALAHCGAGACASVATSIVYTPSECVKQQMQVNGLYQNSWQTFTSLLKQGGLPMLYKGWGAVLCRNVPQSVIKLYTYEALKHWARGDQPRDTPLSSLQALAFGGVAGSTAAFFTTPLDVIKTRLQTQIPGSVQQYNGVIHAFQYIATTEGVTGLYRGLVPRLVIYVTQGALFFASYEFIKHVLAVEVPRLRMKASQIEGYQRRSAASISAEST